MRGGLGRATAVGAATLLLGSLAVAAAQAAPVAGEVDVSTTLRPEPTTVAPGRIFQLNLSTEVVAGTVPKLSATITLPAGLRYLRPSDPNNIEYKRCTPSADGRTVTCRSLAAPHRSVSEQLAIEVGRDVAPGTSLPITATTDIGDAVDTKPEDNTATATVEARTGRDIGIVWKPPRVSVKPGETLVTELVVTNHGPGDAERGQAVRLSIDTFAFGVWPTAPGTCWPDPYTLVCETPSTLAAGESHTFVLRWAFPEKAGGRTFRVPTSLFERPLDPNADNDAAELVLKVAKPSTSTPRPTPTPTDKPTPKPTPTASATASPTATPVTGGGSGGTPQGTGGQLAESGAGPVAAAAATAAGLTLTGGALLAARRARRSR